MFTLDTSNNTLHFWMIDLYGAGGVLWHYELQDGLVLYQEKSVPFFLSFQGAVHRAFNSYLFVQKCRIGFVFLDYFEATTFHDHIKNNVTANGPQVWPIPPTRTTLQKPRRLTHPTHHPPLPPGLSLLPQYGGLLLPGETDSWTPIADLYGHLGREVVGDDMPFTKDMIQNYSKRQQLPANRLKQLPPPPTPPPTTRTRPQSPRRPTRPMPRPPPGARRSLAPQYGSPLLPREMEPRQTTTGIPCSLCERYSSVFCSARSRFTFSQC